MVPYVKKNFILVLTIVLFSFVVSSSYANFSMMVTKDEIDTICTKESIDSSICYELLKPISKFATFDFSDLVKFLIKYQSRNVSDAMNQIKLSAGNATDLQTIDLCVELYEDALHDSDLSLKALADKKYFDVINKIIGLDTVISTCTDELVQMKPRLEVLIKRSNVIRKIPSIIFYILQCYLAKEKTKC
ncbi:hypothetical protein N665_1196s0009 [Sinapis alba]|nr:hypothetical protein N665_1196s0009 [Sinapis alba]